MIIMRTADPFNISHRFPVFLIHAVLRVFYAFIKIDLDSQSISLLGLTMRMIDNYVFTFCLIASNVSCCLSITTISFVLVAF